MLAHFVLAIALVSTGVGTDFSASQCGTGWGAACPSVSNDGSTVEVGATQPGGGDTQESAGSRDRDQSGPPASTTPSTACDRAIDPLCRLPIVYTVDTIQKPTLDDVARFAPASVPFVDEPDGVGVVGMPMNFVVDARPHERTGTLFDLPVTVRFTPDSVLFVHGDGTTRVAADGGSSWADLGLPQFSATSTSHAYSTRGTYSASATVRYVAQVNFGNGWVPVPGLLEIPTTSASIQILEARTALVERTCAENPGGPGC